jgi:hypothetical protein
MLLFLFIFHRLEPGAQCLEETASSTNMHSCPSESSRLATSLCLLLCCRSSLPLTSDELNSELLVFSVPTNNKVYKITCFQFWDSLVNKKHKDLTWFRPICDIQRFDIDRNMCYKGWVESSTSSRVKGVLVSYHYMKGRCYFICGPEVP